MKFPAFAKWNLFWTKNIMIQSHYRHPRPITRCIFCGSKELTREHIFSAWTHRYMLPRRPGKDRSLRGVFYVDRQDTEIVKLLGATRDWQLKCVCGGTRQSCNNGWMKRIEDVARPAMIPLIKGDEIRLTPAQQYAIAAWAVLKCIIAECAFDGRPITHHTQRKRLMHLGKPPTSGWAVWIGLFERRHWPIEFTQWPFLVFKKPRQGKFLEQTPRYYNSNAATQVVGKLFIHTMHCPSSNLIRVWNFTPFHNGTLFRIWPPSPFAIKWPGNPLFDVDACMIANKASDFLLRIAKNSGRI